MEEKELNLKEIGERVKQIRIETGIKQQGKKYTRKQFAEILGYTEPVVQNIEGNHNIKANNTFFEMLHIKFNISKEYLLYGKGKMFVETDKDILDNVQKKYNLSYNDIAIIKAFVSLGASERDIIANIVKKCPSIL
jgi:transcriptional regulator with XRE-family HTH domain